MKKKKLIKVLAIALVLVLGLSAVAFGASVTKSINVMMGGIKLYVDDEQFTPKDANGNVVQPIVYNGTTYLPARAVSEALGKAVHWDNATKSVYIGDHDSSVMSEYLKDVNIYNAQYAKSSEPNKWVALSNTSQKNVQAADGTTDPNGFSFYKPKYDYAVAVKYDFLINQKYSKLKATYLLSDLSKNYSTPFTVSILGDENVLYESKMLTAGFIPQEIDCDVTGISKLTILVKAKSGEEFKGNPDERVGALAITFRDAGLYK